MMAAGSSLGAAGPSDPDLGHQAVRAPHCRPSRVNLVLPLLADHVEPVSDIGHRCCQGRSTGPVFTNDPADIVDGILRQDRMSDSLGRLKVRVPIARFRKLASETTNAAARRQILRLLPTKRRNSSWIVAPATPTGLDGRKQGKCSTDAQASKSHPRDGSKDQIGSRTRSGREAVRA